MDVDASEEGARSAEAESNAEAEAEAEVEAEDEEDAAEDRSATGTSSVDSEAAAAAVKTGEEEEEEDTEGGVEPEGDTRDFVKLGLLLPFLLLLARDCRLRTPLLLRLPVSMSPPCPVPAPTSMDPPLLPPAPAYECSSRKASLSAMVVGWYLDEVQVEAGAVTTEDGDREEVGEGDEDGVCEGEVERVDDMDRRPRGSRGDGDKRALGDSDDESIPSRWPLGVSLTNERIRSESGKASCCSSAKAEGGEKDECR